MQHDVFLNPSRSARSAFPFVAELEADISEATRRIIAPMVPLSAMPGARSPIAPVVRHTGQDYVLILELLGSLPRNILRAPLGSIAPDRVEIIRALDRLFTGT